MKKFEYIQMSQLMASVKGDLPSFKDNGFIDEGNLVKTVMWCNEKLGMPIKRMRETVLKVRNYRTELPLTFQKVIYVAALHHTSFGTSQFKDAFDNFVDLADPDSVQVNEITLACENVKFPVIKRRLGSMYREYTHWTELKLSPASYVYTDSSCINNRVHGKYTINVTDQEIETPFREGELYMMYWEHLMDDDGNILVPFHPLITPWYEWCVKEKILLYAMMNSEADVVNKLKVVQAEKTKSWIDAWNITTEPEYKQLHEYEKRKEMEMWRHYYKWVV